MSAGQKLALLPRDALVNERGRLAIAGCDLVELAEEVGTPAYVYSEAEMRGRAREFRRALAVRADEFDVFFAGKAFPCGAGYRLFVDEGLGVEVSSPGELLMALRSGAEPANMVLGGRHKSRALLASALDAGVRWLVLDADEEIEVAERLLGERGGRQDVLITVVPRAFGVEVRRDARTGQLDRPYGFHLEGGAAAHAIARLKRSRRLRLRGLHLHLGALLADAMGPAIAQLGALAVESGLECEVMNVGGGPGNATVRGADAVPIERHVADRVAQVRESVRRAGLGMPRVQLEPGRGLVGVAGVTLYRVLGVRRGVRTYVTADGGLYENPRSLLYATRQDALLASRPAGDGPVVSVAGATAETGDVLAWDVRLPAPSPGDVLVMPATGAYCHAMASNWNGMLRPPVIFCRDGEWRVVVRRERFADLIRRDVVLADSTT